MSTLKSPNHIDELPVIMIKNFVTLATGGFGLVVALAWNDAIKVAVHRFVDPYFGADGTLVSLFIYAAVVTTLAVFVTMQLTKVERNIEELAGRRDQAKLRNQAKQKRKK